MSNECGGHIDTSGHTGRSPECVRYHPSVLQLMFCWLGRCKLTLLLGPRLLLDPLFVPIISCCHFLPHNDEALNRLTKTDAKARLLHVAFSPFRSPVADKSQDPVHTSPQHRLSFRQEQRTSEHESTLWYNLHQEIPARFISLKPWPSSLSARH